MEENEVLEVPAKRGRKPNEQTSDNTNDAIQEQSSLGFTPPAQKFKVPEKENRVFKLTNNKTQGTVTLVAVEDVIDPKSITLENPNGNPRRMRLLRGATSLWVDEQKGLSDTNGYVEKNTLFLVFNKGTLIIDVKNKLLNQYVDMSNRNLDNPNKIGVAKEYFREWNTEKQADAELKLEELEFEAMGIAASSKIDDIIPHAQYLGVDFIDPMSGHSKDEKGIRTAYMRKAKADPKRFMASIHSPVVQISHKVRRAVESGKIDLGRQPNQAFWVDGGFISVVPQGRNAIEYLTEFAQMQNESSQQFVYQLDNIVP